MAQEGNKDSESAERLFLRSIGRAIVTLSYAEILLSKALKDYGLQQIISYPDTAYYLPAIRTTEGDGISCLGQLPVILNEMRARVKEGEISFAMSRQADESTAYALEIIETIKFLKSEERGDAWTGFLDEL
ncbi:anaerobic carbon-monoxide dehydrogenase catalytic subunit [Candidatus Contubernalis alkaliaceticus]|uniref:hypothetical protein n=1 Tax=Candidatus Contubernalis alkaliaceticus TaxID=338645 RepID=UPI001F4BE829|nr:hypothetical protein [Candidatus Contubernalis alkalaceticus]UNC93384.1 hypothetical protein HUE98_15640 [Candidatus Contubernalis alkalaceticus]